MRNQQTAQRNRSSLSLDELELRYQQELERTIYQSEKSSISDIDLVWQRRNTSKERLGEPAIQQLLKAHTLHAEKNILQRGQEHNNNKDTPDSIGTDALPSEAFITNIVRFIDTHLPSHSNPSNFIKGQHRYLKVFSDEHNQIFWNPCTAHNEVNILIGKSIRLKENVRMIEKVEKQNIPFGLCSIAAFLNLTCSRLTELNRIISI